MNIDHQFARDLWYATYSPQVPNILNDFLCGHARTASNPPEDISKSLVKLLRAPRTIDTHVKTICDHFSSFVSEDMARTLLNKLVMSGILSNVASSVNGSDRAHPISTFVIITKDRPREALRLIDSFNFYLRLFPRKCRLLIVDATSNTSTQSLIRSYASRNVQGCTVEYVGVQEMKRMSAMAKKLGGPEHAQTYVDCAATFSAGASRNLAMLLTQGEHIMMLDDDIVFTFVHDDRYSSAMTLVFGSRSRIASTKFFRTRHECMSHCLPYPRDVLADVESVLGRTTRDIARRFSAQVFCDEINAETFESNRGREAVIRIVSMSLSGDSGRHTGDWWALASRDNLCRLAKDPGLQNLARESREVLDIPRAWLIGEEPWCMSAAVALVNDSRTPPFVARGRNEDGVFAATTQLIMGTACCCVAGVGVPHLSGGYRRYASGANVRSSDIILEIITSINYLINESNPLLDPQQLLLWLINELDDHAYQSLQTAVIAKKLRQVETLKVRLQEQGFRQNALVHLSELGYRLNELFAISAKGGPVRLDDGITITETSELVHGYGQALACWSEMRRLFVSVR